MYIVCCVGPRDVEWVEDTKLGECYSRLDKVELKRCSNWLVDHVLRGCNRRRVVEVEQS